MLLQLQMQQRKFSVLEENIASAQKVWKTEESFLWGARA